MWPIGLGIVRKGRLHEVGKKNQLPSPLSAYVRIGPIPVLTPLTSMDLHNCTQNRIYVAVYFS